MRQIIWSKYRRQVVCDKIQQPGKDSPLITGHFQTQENTYREVCNRGIGWTVHPPIKNRLDDEVKEPEPYVPELAFIELKHKFPFLVIDVDRLTSDEEIDQYFCLLNKRKRVIDQIEETVEKIVIEETVEKIVIEETKDPFDSLVEGVIEMLDLFE